MRPLPRLLAFSDDRIAVLEDLGIRAAAIAAAGPAVALVARRPGGSADELSALAGRFMSLAVPPLASVLVTGRSDIALSVGAQGTILRDGDLAIGEIRQLAPRSFWCLRSVHSEAAADAAIADGADALVVGAIWETATHPDRPALGLEVLKRIAGRGVPSFAIGGVTARRVREVHAVGAHGVAAIRAVWDHADPYQAALALVEPWRERG